MTWRDITDLVKEGKIKLITHKDADYEDFVEHLSENFLNKEIKKEHIENGLYEAEYIIIFDEKENPVAITFATDRYPVVFEKNIFIFAERKSIIIYNRITNNVQYEGW